MDDVLPMIFHNLRLEKNIGNVLLTCRDWSTILLKQPYHVLLSKIYNAKNNIIMDIDIVCKCKSCAEHKYCTTFYLKISLYVEIIVDYFSISLENFQVIPDPEGDGLIIKDKLSSSMIHSKELLGIVNTAKRDRLSVWIYRQGKKHERIIKKKFKLKKTIRNDIINLCPIKPI